MDWLTNPDPFQLIGVIVGLGACYCYVAVIAFDLYRYLQVRRVVHYRWRRMAQVEEALAEAARKEEEFLNMLGS